MDINPYDQILAARRKASAVDPLDYYRNTAQQVETTSEDADSAGIVERVWHTGEGAVKSLARGAIDSVEGIADLGLGVVGGVGGIFSPKFRKLMKDVVEYDAVQEWIFDPLDDIAEDVRGSRIGEHSYIKEGSLPDMVIEGVGGMLPAVAISIATAGLGTPAAAAGTAGTVAKVGGIAGKVGLSAAKAAKVAQVASMATMAAGAAGQATEEAYRDGAGYYGGLGYGITRGAVEAGTEYALGGFTKGLTGGGKLLPGVRQSVAPTGVKRVIKNAVEEGLEEMISEASDPATRTIYQGPEALKKYLDPETYKQIGQAGIVGTATGGVFQGTIGHALGNSGRAADMQEITQELDTLKEKKRNLGKNNKLTDEAYATISEAERENYRVMETVLQKATPEKRAALMENYRLSDKFTEDGTMRADFVASLDRKATVGQMAANAENGAPAGSVTGRAVLDRRTASVDADAEQVDKVLAKEGRTQFTDVDSLSKEGQKNLRNVKRVMDVFHDISDGAVGEFVIAKESVSDNAYFDPETGYTVIGADALENGINVARKGVQSWFQTAIHEVAHGGEGTASHVKLSAILKHIGGGKYYTEMLKQLGSRGYWNGKASDIRAEVEKIIRKVERGEALTDKQTALANVIASEGTSIMAELALGNEHFARELLDADASIVEKLLNRIAEVKEALARRKDAAAKEAFEELRAAEGAFLEALAEKGLRFEKGKIIGAGDEENNDSESIDKPIKKSYNSKYKRVSKEEYAVLSADVANLIAWRASQGKETPRYYYGRTANNFYVYEYFGEHKFNIIKQIRNTDNNQNYLRQIERSFQNDERIVESPGDVDRMHKSIRREFGRSKSYHAPDSRGLEDSGNGGLPAEQQGGDGKRDYRGSDSDQRDGAVKKSRKANSQTSGKNTSPADTLTGQQRQTVANHARPKVYTRSEALEVVEQAARMLDETYGFDGGMGQVSGFVKLTQKVKGKAADELWKAYNSASSEKQRTEVADKLAELMMAEAQLVTIASDEELTEARAVADCLRRYFRKIDLSRIGGEIKAAGLNEKAVRGRWSAAKDGASFTADQIKGEIEDRLGVHIPADNEADIFLWMEEQYRRAEDVIVTTNKALLSSDGMAIADDGLRDRLARSILDSFKEKGTDSAWTKMKAHHAEQVEQLKDEAARATKFAKLNTRAAYLASSVRDWKSGVFLNQSQPKYQNIFKDTIGQLSKANIGGHLIKVAKVRELVGKLGEWYTKENIAEMSMEYNAEIGDYIQVIAKGEGGFTVADMEHLVSVMEYFKHLSENYRKVWKNGKRVDAIPSATEYVKIMKDNQALRKGSVDAVFSSWYLRLYGDPHMLVRYMDKYKPGFYTEMLERMREGAMRAQIYRKRMEDQIRTTMKDYPKYFKELEKRKINLHGAEMPAAEAMSLYMSLFRDQAVAGILENGYCFTDDVKKETVRRVFGFTGDEVIRDKDGNIKPEYKQKIEGLQVEIWGQLTEADRKYINVVWKLLNDDCKTLKRDTDLARMGYTNALEDFYFPIRRANSAQDIDRQTFFDEVSRVSNASFNKDTVKGAKNQLLIEPIDVVVGRHIRGVTMYGALATVIDDYKILKNLNVDESQNHNKPISIATEEQNTWAQGREYFEQLMSDIQGIRGNTDEVTKVIGKIRGNYARFALAANPKVVMTQLSSIFSGMNIIDADCMLKGFSDRGRDVFTYSELAELRASENTAAMAQGLIDEAGDVLMKPIGWMDSYVVRRLWVAAQHQVAKDQKMKVGTEENKKAAGKLLQTVIFETQQNSLATEKSQAARSSSEFQKMVTMFTSDAVKGMGQLLDAFGEISVIRREAKINGTAVDSARLKVAEKRSGRAAASLAAVAIYTTILSQLFRKLLKKEDEEEPWSGFMADTMGAMLGGLPLISDAYEYFFGSGYGLEDMSIAAVNDLMEGIKSLFGTAGAFVTGDLDERDLHKDLRKMFFALGQVTGLPTRNLYNYARAAVHWVSPETGYKMDNAFAKQAYTSDIAKAIEAEDEGRLETVIGVMLDENVGEVTSQTVRQEMNRLVYAGMDVLPRGVGDTVTVDGEAVKLTARQKQAFKSVYSEANKSVEKMVGLSCYADASDEAKAKAIKRVYGIYYNRAIEDLLGVELENKNTLLAEAIDPEVLAVVLAICGEIEADKDANGKAISGSKRRKVEDFVESLQLKAAQKYIIMGALGYKNKLGEAKVQAYVNGLGLSKDEREALMGYSGY